MNKIFISLLTICLLCGCSKKEDEIKKLPEKTFPSSTLLEDSDVTTENLDDYLFLEDTVYIDTRDHMQFLQEGSVAGFVNVPFYNYIVDFNFNENCLYTMTKRKDENGNEILLGEVGSFSANFVESEEMIETIFPRDKNIVFISTAGVESTYMMNLLIQLGYDFNVLYNAGGFSNSSVGYKSYRELKNVKYKIEPVELPETKIEYKWEGLTLVK